MIAPNVDRMKAILQVRPRDIRVEIEKELEIARARQGSVPLATYVGWTGFGNLGDEMMLEVHRGLFPALTVLPYRPGAPAMVRRLWPSASAEYALGFLGGGTLINQSLKWKARVDALLDRGVPVVCLGSGVAPAGFRPAFETGGLTEWSSTLRRMSFVGVRGPVSEAALRDHGVEAHVMGDPVFSVEVDPGWTKPCEDPVVGLNVGVSAKTQLRGSPEVFLNRMTEAVHGLLTYGYRVRLMPVCPEDVASNVDLLGRLGSAGVDLVDCFGSSAAYMAEAGRCRVFIGQKLHATALAIMARVPSAMLAYQPKCDEFMLSLGLGGHSLSTSDASAEWVIEQVAALSRDYDGMRQHIDEGVSYYRDLQLRWARRLERTLLTTGTVEVG